MRPTVTHVTTDRYPASLWLSLLIPYADGSGDRYVMWPDATTPRTDEPARFFYHWERGVGLSHAGNVCAPWGRNLYIPR